MIARMNSNPSKQERLLPYFFCALAFWVGILGCGRVTGYKVCEQNSDCPNDGLCIAQVCVQDSTKTKSDQERSTNEESTNEEYTEPIQSPDGGNTDFFPESLPMNCQPGQQRQCYSGPAHTMKQGACRAGTQQCNSQGSWETCVGETLPLPESCDGKDNNCNGQIDENCQCLNRALS